MKRVIEELTASLIYLFSSIITTLSNKYILSNLGFKMQYLLVAIQSFTIVAGLLVLRITGLVKFPLTNFRKWMVPSLLLSVMIFSGSKSLYYLPISLYTLFKNSSIVVVALLEQRLFKKKISALSYMSFVLMIISSYTGNSSDVVLNIGYYWILINILSTTAYVLSLKVAVDMNSKGKAESVYYSNLISLPILVLLSALFDERSMGIFGFQELVWILISSFCAFLTSFSTAWTLNVLSSTALSMIGALNKSLGSFAGILALGESINHQKIFSLLLGSLASAIYSYDISFRKRD
ncbi:nucleotide-sugar transporter [Encephalitozoon intestinalis ATCC 50506]|uniref:GDP-mannose transporter n=1 Tax=Encephalitozoon intestinalis (strain ATCC 50506) TaxID=876142 RepID=E0S615_ENCIT|nr:nucleotide-sugar transporter [Encephalitozoon intestinalis ATCC 50506]ADM11150.1 nucleotide-sugar transporter [Encephalitozoon intestinalis ATCC 50506]UTX44815.1 nucleotide-sugar transporter [Encephalitozoon intestinalis]